MVIFQPGEESAARPRKLVLGVSGIDGYSDIPKFAEDPEFLQQVE